MISKFFVEKSYLANAEHALNVFNHMHQRALEIQNGEWHAVSVFKINNFSSSHMLPVQMGFINWKKHEVEKSHTRSRFGGIHTNQYTDKIKFFLGHLNYSKHHLVLYPNKNIYFRYTALFLTLLVHTVPSLELNSRHFIWLRLPLIFGYIFYCIARLCVWLYRVVNNCKKLNSLEARQILSQRYRNRGLSWGER
jgi:hypothetical protein